MRVYSCCQPVKPNFEGQMLLSQEARWDLSQLMPMGGF